jgi:hypothetical protein
MIGKPSVIYNPVASSRCRENEWGGVCPKVIPDKKRSIQDGYCMGFCRISEKQQHGKRGFVSEFVDAKNIGDQGKCSYSISK